jgi:hypothetical protein
VAFDFAQAERRAERGRRLGLLTRQLFALSEVEAHALRPPPGERNPVAFDCAQLNGGRGAGGAWDY